jgi:Protein of unknown function (DUF2950)
MSNHREKRKKGFVYCFCFVIITALTMAAALYQTSLSAEANQKTFNSPEEAVKAFIEAAKANDTKALLAILGPAGKEIISSGDEVADKETRERLAQKYDQKNKLEWEGDKKVILDIGTDDWPMPIPVVKKGDTWIFDTKAGKEEILSRRIGRNELAVIQVCLAYVDAQREYALKDRVGDGIQQYAQRFRSEEGKRNGLYWEAKQGEEQSPLGPLAAKAVEEGYSGKKSGGKPIPFHGYYYKILKAQGKNAPGGAYDYMVKGKMIGGFAMVAYPAEYGNSGVMTFIVNQADVVYQKNLGKNTEKIASAMKKYDPDKSWEKAQK